MAPAARPALRVGSYDAVRLACQLRPDRARRQLQRVQPQHVRLQRQAERPWCADRLRCSSAAPVNVRDVPSNGQLGDPSNDCDVVRYDFKLFPGYGGYPGDGGATVLAGHVDYSLAHEGGTGAVVAVGQYWKTMKKGDTIQYTRGDGKTISYTVQWVSAVPLGSDFDYSTLARQTRYRVAIADHLRRCLARRAHEYDERNVVFAVALVSSAQRIATQTARGSPPGRFVFPTRDRNRRQAHDRAGKILAMSRYPVGPPKLPTVPPAVRVLQMPRRG